MDAQFDVKFAIGQAGTCISIRSNKNITNNPIEWNKQTMKSETIRNVQLMQCIQMLYIANNQMPYQMHVDLHCTIQTRSIAIE